LEENPALLLARAWYLLGEGKGERALVMLPYCDRLLLVSRYLQQLLMESLGKEYDRDGNRVEQGLTVYGNKGSTDQHAFVQQLRDGRDDFFVHFIEILKDFSPNAPEGISREVTAMPLRPGVYLGDYLHGFLQGTRQALFEKGRPSLTLSLVELSEHSLGALLALFERAVGFYASFIGVNAYDQPGVEAGKKAAEAILSLQDQVLSLLQGARLPLSFDEIAQKLDMEGREVQLFSLLRRMEANGRIRVQEAKDLFEAQFSLSS
jgi:glucose-6-phosphate isomerase